MALAEDPSGPAPVMLTGAGASIATAAFSPPAGSTLVAMLAAEKSSGAVTATISDSSGQTWRATATSGGANTGYVGVYTAYLTSAPGSISVSVAFTGLPTGRLLDVRVVTGADPVQPTGSAGAYTTPIQGAAITFTTTVSSSVVYGVGACPTQQMNIAPWPGNNVILARHDNTADNTEAASWSAWTLTPGPKAVGFQYASTAVANVACVEVLPRGQSEQAPPLPTFIDGSVVHASDLQLVAKNILNLFNVTQGGVRWAPYVAGGKGPSKSITVLTLATPQNTVSSGAINYIYWDTGLANSDNGWSPLGQLWTFIWTPGVYRLSLAVQLLGITSPTQVDVAIFVNGVSFPSNAVAVETVYGSAGSVSATVQLAVNSYAMCGVQQFSGAPVGFGVCTFTAEYLGM